VDGGFGRLAVKAANDEDDVGQAHITSSDFVLHLRFSERAMKTVSFVATAPVLGSPGDPFYLALASFGQVGFAGIGPQVKYTLQFSYGT